jgi:hypothetical protein
MMKRILLGTALALGMLATSAYAQGTYDHGEIGAFVNYTRLSSANNTNFYGAGGRIGFNLSSGVQLEAEGAYDFSRDVSVAVNVGPGGSSSSATVFTSGLRIAHFLAGPKFQFGGSGPIHVFVTVKGGLIDFSTLKSFPAQINTIPSGSTDGVLYPAAGIELFAGWLGLRVEAGDEIYFDSGANNNLRVTAGPTIRF